MSHLPPPRIRLTMPTRAVLDLLMAAVPEDPPWGYKICEETGLGPGTVYPILERLEEAGWIVGQWETTDPVDRPKRRTYTLSGTGRSNYATAKARQNRKPRFGWVPLRGHS